MYYYKPHPRVLLCGGGWSRVHQFPLHRPGPGLPGGRVGQLGVRVVDPPEHHRIHVLVRVPKQQALAVAVLERAIESVLSRKLKRVLQECSLLHQSILDDRPALLPELPPEYVHTLFMPTILWYSPCVPNFHVWVTSWQASLFETCPPELLEYRRVPFYSTNHDF